MLRETSSGRVSVPTALIVINGDDVYEDLLGASVSLLDLATDAGFVAERSMGMARLLSSNAQAPTVAVLYSALGEFDARQQRALAELVAAGMGLLVVHSGNVLRDADEALFGLIGSRYGSHGPRPHDSRFTVVLDQEHPITRDIASFDIDHEHYRLAIAPGGVRVLAHRESADGPEPLLHVRDHGSGRVCYLQLGHDRRAWADASVRELATRAMLWLAESSGTVAARRALVVVSGDDDRHDLLATSEVLRGLGVRAGLATTRATGTSRFVDPLPRTADADVYVLYLAGGEFSEHQQGALADAVAGGVGLVALHGSCAARPGGSALRRLLGGRLVSERADPAGESAGGEGTEERQSIELVAGHPITDGVADFEILDTRCSLELEGDDHLVLAWSRRSDGSRAPVVALRPVGDGWVIAIALGHGSPAWAAPGFTALVRRAVGWAR